MRSVCAVAQIDSANSVKARAEESTSRGETLLTHIWLMATGKSFRLLIAQNNIMNPITPLISRLRETSTYAVLMRSKAEKV